MEATFPLYSTDLVSGAFYNKDRNGPAGSLPPDAQREAQATDRRTTTPAASRPPPTRYESGHEPGTSCGTSHGTPHGTSQGTHVPTADRGYLAPPAPPRAIAVRYAEQQRIG